MLKITMPENDTKITMNVAGKGAKQVAKELAEFAWLLNALAESDFECTCNGFVVECEDEESVREMAKPDVMLEREDTDEDGDIVSSYLAPFFYGYTSHGNRLDVLIEKDLIDWIRSDKPLDDYFLSISWEDKDV